MNSTTVRVNFCATIIFILLLVFAIPVMADQTAITIKPGTLKDALDAYSKASSTKIVYLNELIEGKNSPGAQNASPGDALLQILQGTGLSFQMTENNTVILKEKNSTEKQPVTDITGQQENKTEKSEHRQAYKEMILSEMTVTAQKREESVQEVPISMTVFDEIEIEDSKIESIQDVASYTSNFALMNKSTEVFTPTIRGVSNSLPFASSTSQPVSVIIDGIPISNSQGFNVALLDIERIEVLKGPQGTLYGKEAEAGVINIITKKPDNETRGKVGVELGEDNKRQYTFSASGPIAEDKLFVGVSAKHYEKDGFINNTLLGGYTNDRENDYGRVNFRYTPNDNIEISLISSKLELDNGNMDYVSPYVPGDKSVSTEEQGYDESSVTTHALKISYDINDYLLESITTYRNVDSDAFFVYISMPEYIFDREHERYSQELRLSNSSDVFKWVAGVYADKYEVEDSSYYVTNSSPTTREAEGDSIGVFIHTDYAINDKFSFISGVRYDKDNKEYEQSTTELDLSDDEISPKISLKYQHNKNTMYYTTISKGYRAGGFCTSAPDGYPKQYEKETLWNYEIGAKKSFFDNRLVVNSSIFYMQIDDMQVRIFPIAGSRSSYVSNAAEATSKGFEIGLNAKLTNSLELFGAYGYTDCTFDGYSDEKGDYSGNKNTYAPVYNYNIGVKYRGGQGFFARVVLNGYGKTYFDVANTNSRDAYNLVNAKIGYEAEGYDIYLYGKNIFDKEYNSVNMFNGNGVIYSPPREVGVQLNYRF
jgi:iron complex outermembrane receptor protein